MAKLPRTTADAVLRALQRDGWHIRRQSGSHVVLRHPRKAGRLVLPRHAGTVVKPGTLFNIIKDAGLTVEEFTRLL